VQDILNSSIQTTAVQLQAMRLYMQQITFTCRPAFLEKYVAGICD